MLLIIGFHLEMPRKQKNNVKVFLSLGSNVGNRREMLLRARDGIFSTPQIRSCRSSSITESTPVLYEDQADFLNQVLEIETSYSPFELLAFLQELEKKLGRIKRFRYGPREIDLDILSYGKIQSQDPRLILPHPSLGSRAYLDQLLNDLDTSAESILSNSTKSF